MKTIARKMRINDSLKITCTVLSVLLVSCASSSMPTIGDDMALERDEYSSISKTWAKGQKLVVKGNKLLDKGEKQIRDGNKNVAKGEDMLRRGERMMRDSEREYKLKKATSS